MLKLNIKAASEQSAEVRDGEGNGDGDGGDRDGHAPGGNIKMTSINTPINHRETQSWQTECKRRRFCSCSIRIWIWAVKMLALKSRQRKILWPR